MWNLPRNQREEVQRVLVTLAVALAVTLAVTLAAALAIRTAQVIREIQEVRKEKILRTNFISFFRIPKAVKLQGFRQLKA